MTAIVLRGDARHLPLPDDSADLIVTSPPYFGLRSYTDAGEHYDGQIGSEPTPASYIAALVDCTREWVRVLKPSGSLWVNLGDKYATGSTPGPQSANTTLTGGRHKGVADVSVRRLEDGRPKSLLGLPWRYALACTDQLGLILRAEVIWSKPNGLPESVTDRVRRSHEQWFHLTRMPRYYSAVDEIREPHARPLTADQMRSNAQSAKNGMRHGGAIGIMRGGEMPRDGGEFTASNPLGKLPGSVWTIPSQPLTVPPSLGVDHFAAFPMEWPRRIIQGWSPTGICTACGEGRRPVDDGSEKMLHRPSGAQHIGIRMAEVGNSPDERTRRNCGNVRTVHRITGYACACPQPTAPTRPAVVLDPFSGTGTVALVASALGRVGIGVDMSMDYSRLAMWRTTDPGQRAAAMQVDKPPPVIDGQEALWA